MTMAIGPVVAIRLQANSQEAAQAVFTRRNKNDANPHHSVRVHWEMRGGRGGWRAGTNVRAVVG